jgi:hypothetical protein
MTGSNSSRSSDGPAAIPLPLQGTYQVDLASSLDHSWITRTIIFCWFRSKEAKIVRAAGHD